VSLAQLVKLHLKPIVLLLPPPVGGAASHLIGGFHVPLQEQTNWCWSAVSAGVAARAGAVWQQCNIAGLELGQTCCPMGTNPAACNVAYYLDLALTRVGRFGGMVGGAAPLAQVTPKIDADLPVCVRIGWSGGGGHFVAIAGYSTSSVGTFIDVEDPLNSASTVTLAVLQTMYKGTGTWTHTYWTT
jgi:hypothetical protein